jgi:Fe-S-cluster containining protein
MGTLPVPRDCLEVVRARAERDSVLPGPKRKMVLDCLECGACCVDNEVMLEKKDIARFVAAGRADLAKPPYARRKDGKTVLVLRKDKRCKHLGGDNKCDIYALRPDACSTFPAGSECCLFSREEELGIVDGLGLAR